MWGTVDRPYKNVLEEIIPTLVNVMLYSTDFQTYCHCNSCRTNIIVQTLNALPPRYVSNGEQRKIFFDLYNKPYMRKQLNQEIVRSIYRVGKKKGECQNK